MTAREERQRCVSPAGKVACASAVGILVVLGAALLISGCADEQDLATPNLPPETYLAVSDSVKNVTLYIQNLSWWGEDRDGEVVGFEYRWFTDPTEKGCAIDTNWVFTEARNKTFNLPVTDGLSAHRFEVRAVDDDDEADPTPCRAELPVKNSAPELRILDVEALPETTLTAFMMKWQASDSQGVHTIAGYRVWLDGSEAEAITLSARDTVASLGPADFGPDNNRLRTVHVVAIDSGCDTSATQTHTWFVKQPAGRVLLVDDVPNSAPAEKVTDAFYRGALDSCQGAYSVLDLENSGGVLYAQNLPELFGMFDLVIWYDERTGTTNTDDLAFAERPLRDYVEGGGRVMITSHVAFGSGGAFRDSVSVEVFGIDSLVVRNGSTNFDCIRWKLLGNTAVGLDSLKVQLIFQGSECILPAETAVGLYYIPPGTVGPSQKQDYFVGVVNTWGTGRAAIFTFPFSRSNQFGNARSHYCKGIQFMLQ